MVPLASYRSLLERLLPEKLAYASRRVPERGMRSLREDHMRRVRGLIWIIRALHVFLLNCVSAVSVILSDPIKPSILTHHP
jgi:hypothetical protein